MTTSVIPYKSFANSIPESSPTRSLQSRKDRDRQNSTLSRADLKPRVKSSRDGAMNEPLMYFATRIGPRRIPRRRYPLRPSSDMIQNARRGIMSKFLRLGKIIRASDFEPMVDLQTAKLNLTDDIELETDHLSRDDEQMPESQRTKENLFYIAVKDDELPSYHFWKADKDPDPLHTHRGIDWDQVLGQSPTVQGALADLDRTIAQSKTKTRANPQSTPTVQNAWTKAGDGELGPLRLKPGLQSAHAPYIRSVDSTNEEVESNSSLSEITGMEKPGQTVTHPDPETRIYNTTNKTEQQSDVKERERRTMGQAKRQKPRRLVHEAGSKDDDAVVQSLMEPELRALEERQASPLRVESVYNNPSGRIEIPKHGSSLEPTINGGPDFPTIYARVLTLAEIEGLQKQLHLRENELSQREVSRDPPRQPRLRRDLVERMRNEENPRQAPDDRDQPPLQSEEIKEWRRHGKNKETNQSRGLGSVKKLDAQPQTVFQPPPIDERPQRVGTRSRVNKQPQNNFRPQNVDDEHQITVRPRNVNPPTQTTTGPPKPPSAILGPDALKLPEKPKNTAYYCNVCLINTTRFSIDRKKAHAQACSTTIGNSLALTPGKAAAAKKLKAMDGENSKTEPKPTDSTTNAVQIGNLAVTAHLTEETAEVDGGSPSVSTGGIKRKKTATPIAGAKRAQKKRRR